MKSLFLMAALSSFQAVQPTRVYDGDTFKVNLPGRDDVFGKDISIRIRGIDAPEIKSDRECERKAALASKEALSSFLGGKRIDLNRCKRDQYFRLDCDVILFGQKEQDAAAYQLAKGHAVPYTGKTKRKPWVCKGEEK